MYSHFELICTLKANCDIPVYKYRSKTTGLTVVLADIEGPVVNGFFCLATEAHDDDGLPHTLEHLVFLGSEKYPYKGTLDLLANRCLASGTNAWTDVDHTCYLITTAGSGGFLSLLPVYLDHVLYPTLSESGFITEVHHIAGDGTDGGVVYCEMQGRESTGESRVHRALCRNMYANSGYASETGGIMKNLRESTTSEKVRAYHADFYIPENLTIIITGKVTAQAVFAALAPVEERILKDKREKPFNRPWRTPVAPLSGAKDIRVLYPSDEEDAGMVYVGVMGPESRDIYTVNACAILLRYLTDNSISPIQREFVENDDPMASDVGFGVTENYKTMLQVYFENVPTSKIDQIAPKLKTVLANIGSCKEKLDMSRIATILDKHNLETLTSLENTPHSSIAYMLIGDVLYGDTIEDLDHRLNSGRDMKKLLCEDSCFWLDLLNKYFVDNDWITIRGVPSIEEQTTMTEQEKKRVEKQKTDLGKDGLETKERELKKAMAANEVPPPKEILTSIPVPSTDDITFHKVRTWTNNSNHEDLLNELSIDLGMVPIHTRVHELQTNFVYIFLTMDSSVLTDNLRPYIPLFLELLLESPVLRNGELIPHEEVVSGLERDTIGTECRVGLENYSRFSCGPYSNVLTFAMQVETKKYAIGAKWIIELLYNTKFLVERIKILANKIINDVATSRKNGNKVTKELRKVLAYNKGSNVHACSMLYQLQFLNTLLTKLSRPLTSQEVLDDLEEVRKNLTRQSCMALHIAARWSNLQSEWDKEHHDGSLMSVWTNIVPQTMTEEKKSLNITPDWKLMQDTTGGCIVGLGSIESSFMIQTAPCINDFKHEDVVPVMVYLQYLTQLEGPMWKQIRGKGLSYGYSIYIRPNEGNIALSLFKATNPILAYEEARTIVKKQLCCNTWDEEMLQSARSSLVFEIIERVTTIGSMVNQSLQLAFKNVDNDYNRKIVDAIGRVTLDDLTRVGTKWVAPLFDPKLSLTTLVCCPERVSEMYDGFKRLGYELKICNSLDESPLAKITN